MAKYATHKILEWLYADGTHPAVIVMCVQELVRRAERGEG